MNRAVFDLRTPVDWHAPLRQEAWAMLPLGTRPMVATWVEQACAHGCHEFVVMPELNQYSLVSKVLGDGTRWGCRIEYRPHLMGDDRFRPDQDPSSEDILWMNQPCLLSDQLVREPITSLQQYYQLNLDLAAGLHSLPVAPGYAGGVRSRSGAGESVGLEPIMAPSARFHPPLMIGDHVRVNGFAELGPKVVVGNHVVIGRGSRVVNSMLMDHSYVGPGLNIEGRIVDGPRLIDPVDGVAIELDDLLLADLKDVPSPMSMISTRVRGWFGKDEEGHTSAASRNAPVSSGRGNRIGQVL